MKGEQSFSPTTIVYFQGGVNIFKRVGANIPPCTHSNPALLKHSNVCMYVYKYTVDSDVLVVCGECYYLAVN